MHIRTTKPVKLMTRNGPVVIKPHHTLALPDHVVKRLLGRIPEIRRSRAKR